VKVPAVFAAAFGLVGSLALGEAACATSGRSPATVATAPAAATRAHQAGDNRATPPESTSAKGAEQASSGSAEPAPPAPPAAPPKTPEQPPAKPVQQAAQDIQKPTFKTGVTLVTTDVIVRDSKGQFVSDLKPGDFEVFEDNVKQDLMQFDLVHGGRVYNSLMAPPPPAQEGIILPPSRPANDTAGRIFLLFVDDLHLQFNNTGRIRELFKKMSKELIHDGDLFGIVSTGPSSIAIDLTYDRRRLDEAIKKMSGNELKPSEIIQGPESSEGPSEVRYRAHVAFSTALDLMKNLEQVHNRRKAIIYVSDGYDFNPFTVSRSGQNPYGYYNNDVSGQQQDQQTDPTQDQMRQGQQFADADLARELADLTRAANRANATIYTIDPRGLVGGQDLDENLDPSEWQDYIRKSQDSLRVLADETGGIAVVNQNDFDKALKRIDAETSDYYMLGYYSNNPDPTRRNRTIEVKVKRSDLQVWSRKGYSLKVPPKTGS
jgi:VWFA-related protein